MENMAFKSDILRAKCLKDNQVSCLIITVVADVDLPQIEAQLMHL